MSYRFERDESVQDAIARCAREQLDAAVHELSEGYERDPVEAVHAARKAVRKERALLRLARAGIPRAERSSENAALRNAARGLSDARDGAAMFEAYDQLAEKFVGQVPEKTFTSLRKGLERHLASRRVHDVRSGEARAAAEDLASIRARIDSWEIGGGDWRAVGPGLERTYRRGRAALRQARRERSDEALHASRKRVKDLWYQLRLLERICGPAVGGQAREAHTVADLLGDDHDLAVLRATIQTISPSVAADVEAVLGLLDYRRGELQSEAVYLGERLYAEKPTSFARRIRQYWRAGRAELEAVEARRPAALAGMTRSLARA